MSRRRVLGWGLGGVAALALAGASGVELVLHDVLPGRGALERATGGCSLPAPALSFGAGATSTSGTLFSQARNRTVGYSIAYPPGHPAGSPLPLVVVLHGFGRNHANVLTGLTLAQATALVTSGSPLPPVALVAADGGNGYWHPHPGDDPLAMVVEEVIPMCQGLGLGRPGLGRRSPGIGALGISMGAYGALLLAETHPGLVAAVAGTSPAVWTSYAQANGASPGAFDSPADFEAHDVIANAARLGDTAVWVASGKDDPFHPGVVALAGALPPGATVSITKECHDDAFWASSQPGALRFVAGKLTA